MYGHFIEHLGGVIYNGVAVADRITFKSDEREPKPSWLDGVSASATVHAAPGGQRQRVVLTVTNPRLDQPVSATVALHDATVRAGDVTPLTHSDPRARNTVAAPNMVQLGATTGLALGSKTPSEPSRSPSHPPRSRASSASWEPRQRGSYAATN